MSQPLPNAGDPAGSAPDDPDAQNHSGTPDHPAEDAPGAVARDGSGEAEHGGADDPSVVEYRDGLLDDGEAERFDPEELRRYEEERAARRKRRDALAMPVVGFVVAVALAFLAYDSLVAMGEARENGDSWVWDAVVAAGCLAGLAVLVLAGIRRVRR